MTVQKLIQQGAAFLGRKGVASPRLQIELLLSHVLGLPRLNLYLDFERELTEGELGRLKPLVRRRALREPLQHMLGSTSFCGLEFAVDGRVMVPRPETELLAERAWRFVLGYPQTERPRVLDFGTGSGCLVITLAVKCPGAEFHAVDISAPALEVARLNATRHDVASRVQFHLGDGFEALPPSLLCDLVISNPPYIPGGDIAGLDPEVRDHDPTLALDGGPDGLNFYRRLANEGSTWMRHGARLMTEFGDGQAEPIRTLFHQQNWIVEAIEPDYSGRARILIARMAA